MKYLVISDLHLTEKFIQPVYEHLKEAIQQADRVIINGDLWDGYREKFDRFVESEWNSLFPMLLEKQCIYLWGNHDQEKFCNERVNEFSVKQTQALDLNVAGKEYYITHGNNISPMLDEINPVLFANNFWHKIIDFLTTTGEYILKKRYFDLIKTMKRSNNKMRKWRERNLSENTILVCGHTHFAEIDEENNFINTGFICPSRLQYVFITDTGSELVDINLS